jgi:hypothetical protein
MSEMEGLMRWFKMPRCSMVNLHISALRESSHRRGFIKIRKEEHKYKRQNMPGFSLINRSQIGKIFILDKRICF